jgi:hypothetical protein
MITAVTLSDTTDTADVESHRRHDRQRLLFSTPHDDACSRGQCGDSAENLGNEEKVNSLTPCTESMRSSKLCAHVHRDRDCTRKRGRRGRVEFVSGWAAVFRWEHLQRVSQPRLHRAAVGLSRICVLAQ